jgi:hypothetical protein
MAWDASIVRRHSRAAPRLEAESHEAQASQHASGCGKLLLRVGLLETYLRHF